MKRIVLAAIIAIGCLHNAYIQASPPAAAAGAGKQAQETVETIAGSLADWASENVSEQLRPLFLHMLWLEGSRMSALIKDCQSCAKDFENELTSLQQDSSIEYAFEAFKKILDSESFNIQKTGRDLKAKYKIRLNILTEVQNDLLVRRPHSVAPGGDPRPFRNPLHFK